MKMLHLTNTTMTMIRERAEGTLRLTGCTRRADGSWDVPFAEMVVERLDRIRHPG